MLNSLLKICKFNKDREKIIEIFKYRDIVLKNNRFLKKKKNFILNFKNQKIFLNEASAFSALEVFNEVFNLNDHTNHKLFKGYKEKLIVDIGSHNLFYPLKILRNNKKVKFICVEPNKSEIKIAKKNIKLNKIKNIKIFNYFVTNSKNRLTNFQLIKELPAIGGLSLFKNKRKWIKDEFISNIKVKNVSLKKLINDNNINKIDILKIDAEGSELKILKSFNKFDIVKKITLEFHSLRERNRLIEFLKKKKFKLLKHTLNKKNYGSLYFINKNIKFN
ncbi:FkbM family methyltransferase [Candidatus Pelagibacter sp.]|nr:FkbM family methyltransferase [Candidatus Pelagibacter sp.]